VLCEPCALRSFARTLTAEHYYSHSTAHEFFPILGQ